MSSEGESRELDVVRVDAPLKLAVRGHGAPDGRVAVVAQVHAEGHSLRQLEGVTRNNAFACIFLHA